MAVSPDSAKPWLRPESGQKVSIAAATAKTLPVSFHGCPTRHAPRWIISQNAKKWDSPTVLFVNDLKAGRFAKITQTTHFLSFTHNIMEKSTNKHEVDNNNVTRSSTGDTVTSQALPFAPHTAGSAKVVEALKADPKIGLSESDAARRLEVHGPNRLKPPKRPSVLKIIVRQTGNAMTLVLSKSL